MRSTRKSLPAILTVCVLFFLLLLPGCTDSNDSKSPTTTTKAAATTSTATPTTTAPIAKPDDQTYDARAQFDKEKSDGSNGVWSYMYTLDSGAEYLPNGLYMDEYTTWYPAGETWFGAGINASPDLTAEFPDSFEVLAGGDKLWSALTFTAPAKGTFKILPFDVFSPWGEEAVSFFIEVNGEVVFQKEVTSFDLSNDEPVLTAFEGYEATLEPGQTIRFYGKTAKAGVNCCYDMSSCKIEAKYE